MAREMISVTVNKTWLRWLEGLDHLEEEYRRAAERPFRLAADALLDESQRRVHVLSGRLKTSGRLAVDRGRTEIEATVSYGGMKVSATGGRYKSHTGETVYVPGGNRDVDYAIYEEARHPYLLPAFEATHDRFEDALFEGWDSMLARWRR